MRTITLSILIASLLLNSPVFAAGEDPKATENSDAFLDMVEKQTFRYFLNEYHPETGLINDSSANHGQPLRELRTSIAATGFGINAFIIGSERGWISNKEAYERILTALRFFSERAETQHGFFYHFLEGREGKNVYESELSSIDTALLLAGMLTAAEYFPGTKAAEIAKSIYERVDFNWMRNRTTYLCMGWQKESGFLPSYWSGFAEGLLLYILATGSPTYPVPNDSWSKVKKPVAEREGETFMFAGPLFIHQYPQVWLDLRNKNDGVADYFENSRRATRANKKFSENNAAEFKTYAEGYWGLSAYDGPAGYKAYGASDRNSHDGTISPLVSGASIVFEPELSIAQMRKVYSNLKDKMWGRYGFSDSMNLDRDWRSKSVIGIDAGALLSMIENYRTGLIWRLFMQNENVKRGLALAGFVEGTMEPALSKAPEYTVTHRGEQAISVDGDLNEWGITEQIMLADAKHIDYGVVRDRDDLSANVSFLWDETHLFIAAAVHDDQIVAKRTVRYSYKDDLLELFMDLDGDGFRWKSPRDPQFGFSFDPKTKRPRLYNWGEEKEIELNETTKLAMKLTAGGYRIEAALSWAAFGIVPENLLQIAATPAIHDADQKKEAKLSWHFRDLGTERGIELGHLRLRKATA
ncbi:MAG: hypothetical protein HY587_05525 [Candidatus Omnitrophica bacterium]|nr:hypothetical protein [Candidatus Omnitrophota bacterium]